MYCAASIEADAEQVGRLAAGLDLGAGPLAVAGAALVRVERELAEVDLPDPLPLRRPGQIDEEDRVEPARPGELGRELGDVVGREDEERIAGVIGHVRQQRPELAGGDAAVTRAALLDAGQALLDLVGERDIGPGRRQDAQCLPGPLLGQADEPSLELAQVEDDRGPAHLVAERLGERRFAGPGDAQDEHAPWPWPAGSGSAAPGGRTP